MTLFYYILTIRFKDMNLSKGWRYMEESTAYTIHRVLSNNAVQVSGEKTGAELILMGKGLGFGAKTGMSISPADTRIEKRFTLDDPQAQKHYQVLLEQVDSKVLDVSQDIIALISQEFGTEELNEQVFIALPSHIQFALHRLNSHMEIVNPFLYEIQALHSREFALAKKASELISNSFQIEVPETEVGFLAMHIQSAVCHISLGNIVKLTHLIQETVHLIESETGIKVPRDSIDYIRLITHLRFALERLLDGKISPNPFAIKLKKTLTSEYRLAQKIAIHIEERLGLSVPEDEVGYIVMHLYRLLQQYERFK